MQREYKVQLIKPIQIISNERNKDILMEDLHRVFKLVNFAMLKDK